MAQRPNNYPIDPNTTSGTDLADLMNQDEVAESSNNSGNARPAYITAGGIWTKTGTGGAFELMMYDGTTDHRIGDNQNGTLLSSPPSGTSQTIIPGDGGTVPLTIKGVAGQSASLQEWQDGTGAKRVQIQGDGRVKIGTALAPAVSLLSVDDINPVVISAVGRGYHNAMNGSGFAMEADDQTALDGQAWSITSMARQWGVTNVSHHVMDMCFNVRADTADTTLTRVMTLHRDKVLIGTTIPNADAGVLLTVGGKIAATASLVTSDKRLKSDIEVIPDALEKVGKLKGYTFQKKDVATRQAGLIAQEVLEVLPEAVSGGPDKMMSVDHVGIIGLLVEALNEATARIEKLEEKQK